jgi:2-polyprenyl-6-hydroxyphenyl methylase/3-demethylubiquinone-9 3-methyltransferase
MFIRPEELRARLEALGFAVGPVAGLGPCGVNRRLDVVFRALPSVSIMYMGHARKPPAAEG